jgi:hypothetical protein
VQNAINAISQLLDAAMVAKRTDGATPAAAVAVSRKQYASKAKENKRTRQGEGKKGCAACGWRPREGEGIGLFQHRATCVAYKSKHPGKKA